MTAEEKREQQLKRILPALFITVIYYVFITDIVGEPAKKAEESFLALQKEGVSTEGVTKKIAQKSQLDKQISGLQSKVNVFKEKLNKMAGFLNAEAASNESTAILSEILNQYQLRVIKEENKPYAVGEMTPSLQEIEKLLKAYGKKKTSSINAQHILLSGSYISMYQAMNAIANGRLKAIPVVLDLLPPVEGADEDSDSLPQWELVLWMWWCAVGRTLVRYFQRDYLFLVIAD